MLRLSKYDITLLRQVLSYLEENYAPYETECTDKFVLLSECDRVTEKSGCFMSIEELFEKTRGKEKTSLFCESFLAHFHADYVQLKKCCREAGFSKKTFAKICDKTFFPTKVSAFKLLIAANVKFEIAVPLLEAAGIYCDFHNKFDVVMAFFFEKEVYDLSAITRILFLLDLPVLCYTFL